MAIKMKPVSYGPVTVATDLETLTYQSGDAEALSAPELTSPAITLLYSIGACMVLSLQMIAKNGKTDIQPFSISVTMHKAENLPARFDRYEITLSADIHEDREVAEKLLKSAKSICTVSNSLSGEFTLTIADA